MGNRFINLNIHFYTNKETCYFLSFSISLIDLKGSYYRLHFINLKLGTQFNEFFDTF